VLFALLKGITVFLLLALLGRRIARPALHWVAARRSPELFMLTTLLILL
jgi:Kef-type K+ transport system membrane component KefB